MIKLKNNYSANELTDILSISYKTLESWEKNKKLIPTYDLSGRKFYQLAQVIIFPEFAKMASTKWFEELNITPSRKYNSIELFAGAGGLGLGLEMAGFNAVLLNELDKHACSTLRANRPAWNVIEDDISNIDFSVYQDKIDFISGGFPCQSFSYAGKKMGFEDARGTLFFEFARAIKEIKPRIFLGENVRGLLKHDDGRTVSAIKSIIKDLGYTLIEPKVLKALFFKVPQKRERLFFIGIRNDLAQQITFKWPDPYYRVMTIRDALCKGELFNSDVPKSKGQQYPLRKKEILSHVPQGGYWRNLPIDLQKEYMKASFYLGGGKTGMARRLSWDAPSLTLTCAPAQKQTERCHPDETRPLTVREYARIQTFPDNWIFTGPLSSQYKQIGNAVPVNLAYAVGRSLIRLLNDIEQQYPFTVTADSNVERLIYQPTQLQLLNIAEQAKIYEN